MYYIIFPSLLCLFASLSLCANARAAIVQKPAVAPRDHLRRRSPRYDLRTLTADAPLSDRPTRFDGHCIALACVIVAGAAIRFTLLRRPCLWGDEAFVYWRISGTFNELLDRLRDDGFTPLHYELAWALTRRLRPTPVVLRLVPTLCGSLTVPAVYFLARQLLDRRASLLATLLAATSAFGFFYSRDAKMYGELWLLCTLNLGCLLWWLRTGHSTAWLGWVAAGCLAAGFHADGMIFPALSPLLLLTSRRPRWSDALWLTLGLLLIALGPAGYYGTFNTWNQRVENYGWMTSGLNWIDAENEGRTGPAMVRSTLTSFFYGWTYPIPSLQPLVSHRAFLALSGTWFTLAITLLLAMLPWPARWRLRAADAPTQPPWRTMLWLGLLIVPAGYVFYCHSMPLFDGPIDWCNAAFDALPHGVQAVVLHRWGQLILGSLLVATIVAGITQRSTRAHAVRFVQIVIVAAVLIGVCEVLYVTLAPMALEADAADRSWHSLWVPRYLGFLWPLLTVGTAALLLRLPTRPVRVTAVSLLVLVNGLMIGRRVFADTEPPVDRMAADVFASQPQNASVRTYTNLGHGDVNPGGGDLMSNPGRYYLQLLGWKQPMSPNAFHLILYGYRLNAGYGNDRIVSDVLDTPRLDDVITWVSYEDTPPAKLALPSPWTCVSEKTYAVTAYWDWKPKMTYVRREYRRPPVAGGG